jgi:outer membrane protein OmpA-like peptidoglycan-associated protein
MPLARAMIRPIAAMTAMLAAAWVAGCALAPAQPAGLEQARAAVERARSAPRVRALAAAELDRAEVSLQRAEAAAAAGAPAGHVDHLAYVASRQAALATAHAADRVAQAEVEVLEQALDQLLAQAPPDHLRQVRAAGAALPAAIIDAGLPELTLSLSELAFADAEPAGDSARRLDEVAERLIAEPARRVTIEADFALPDPVTPTLVERRIETVRAALLHRGIEASRIGVRASPSSAERTLSAFDRLAP